MRFSKKQRLQKKREFLHVREKGDAAHGPAFIVQAAPSLDVPSCQLVRVGVVATRRVGNAVQRNRAKRLLRALFQTLAPEMRAECKDIVLVAKPAIFEYSFTSLTAFFRKALSRHALVD